LPVGQHHPFSLQNIRDRAYYRWPMGGAKAKAERKWCLNSAHFEIVKLS
jgi:hypothetical protein